MTTKPPVSAAPTAEAAIRAPLSLEHARSYDEWLAAARRHDDRTGGTRWRRTVRSRRYDYAAIQKRLAELEKLAGDDVQAVLYYLNEGIHGNMGGMGNARMYNRALAGTKDLVTSYINLQAEAIERVAAADESDISRAEKRDFLQRAHLCFGRSALMLSGGGALGPFHIGVARALLSQGLLPSVISGSSAGSFIAATLGTHTDAELGKHLTVQTAIEVPHPDVEAKQVVGSRITIEAVRASLEREIPDLTFQEAFELTGRRINITVSPSEFQQNSRLLNAVTSPNVFIREAVLASTAVPGVFEPVTLMAKNFRGERQPYIPSRKWADGSVSDDLPAKRLARLYGVNYFITSQINPAVLWAAQDVDWDDTLPARLWDVFQTASREYMRATFPFVMGMTRDIYPLNLQTRMAYSVALQDYTADINIIPRRRHWDPSKLLAVWSEKETLDLIRDGERSTWPKIEMIRNCTRLGRTLERLVDEFDHDPA